MTTVALVLSIMGTVLRTAHGVTPEDAEAYCAMVPSCKTCQSLCYSFRANVYGKLRYTSGCGEYCDVENGTITAINFNYKGLTALSSEIGRFTSLDALDLSTNSLTTLPTSLKSLRNLEKLYISLLSIFVLTLVCVL